MKPVNPAMFDPEFFPTPKRIATQMLAKIANDAVHFLEPSAGRGDLAEVIAGEAYDGYDRHGTYGRRRNGRIQVDCIEQSQELVAILTSKEFPVVGYDWLDYSGICYYDAIVMNPPFSNGDKHLLKAWDFLHDGEIVCLLNEETIKNPRTETRKRLAAIVEKHGNVEFLGDCFTSAERKTDVRVAMVYLKKVSDDDSVELWSTGAEEKKVDETTGEERNFLAIKDTLGNMEHYYNMANEHMLKAIQHMRKAGIYLAANDIGVGQEYERIAGMCWGNCNGSRAEFIKKHRRDAWMQVFSRMEFRKWLDKKQSDEMVRDIERNGNIPFTTENIKGTLENIFQSRHKLFEISVANVFDELTKHYHHNRFGNEGWKTNDSYKVNRKLIFPYGCTFESKYGNYFSLKYGGGDIDVYADLDRVLCVLDGQKFEACYRIDMALRTAFERLGRDVRSPFDNQTESQHFDIRFFKKGTLHLTFKNEKLWEQFNVTAAKGKAWLGENTRNPEPEQARIF